MGIEPHHNPRLWGGGPGTQKHTHTTPGRDRPVQANDLFHTSIPTRDRGTVPRAWGTHRTRTVP
ncbi:hypothetical protein GBB04_01400 [Bifidobacterium dentium]|uniref:Uncharacterized protein n=1 Tax=Bifidobacterium dentium TaxID=1689 RepID=A0A7J5TK95_9BIFI|nr:hypothetical protein GBA94_09935 [Bifidobacterium dentium]KAB7462456.1 hypothetical protein GBB04_01400 [Bifidobacterium dentium]KAB7464556.1 hypothetical protein GBB12_06170 [Bifidobacterium dentium]RYT60785.1 hypothetical protein EAI74_11035 [Bifidobacterium dentium]